METLMEMLRNRQTEYRQTDTFFGFGTGWIQLISQSYRKTLIKGIF